MPDIRDIFPPGTDVNHLTVADVFGRMPLQSLRLLLEDNQRLANFYTRQAEREMAASVRVPTAPLALSAVYGELAAWYLLLCEEITDVLHKREGGYHNEPLL